MTNEVNAWNRLVLPPHVKAPLLEACTNPRSARPILVYGPPGTGKTEVGRTIASTGIAFVAATPGDLLGMFVGQSAANTRRLVEKARAMSPAVLFMDELDSVARERESRDWDPRSAEVVTELLAQMDGNVRSPRPVFMLATALSIERLDSALRARFAHHIEMPLPDKEARRTIIKRLLSERPVEADLDIDAVATAVAKETNGCSGRDLTYLVDGAVRQAAERATSETVDIRLTRASIMDQLEQLKRQFRS